MNTMRSMIFAVCVSIGWSVVANVKADQHDESKPVGDAAYDVIVPGLLGSKPVPLAFPSLSAPLDQRDFIMGPGEAKEVPTPAAMLFELRGGTLVTTINGKAQARHQGDFWEVEKGATLAFNNSGSVAVMRVIYLNSVVR